MQCSENCPKKCVSEFSVNLSKCQSTSYRNVRKMQKNIANGDFVYDPMLHRNSCRWITDLLQVNFLPQPSIDQALFRLIGQ